MPTPPLRVPGTGRSPRELDRTTGVFTDRMPGVALGGFHRRIGDCFHVRVCVRVLQEYTLEEYRGLGVVHGTKESRVGVGWRT